MPPWSANPTSSLRRTRPRRAARPGRRCAGTCSPGSSPAAGAGGGWNHAGPTAGPPTGAATDTPAPPSPIPDGRRTPTSARTRSCRTWPPSPSFTLSRDDRPPGQGIIVASGGTASGRRGHARAGAHGPEAVAPTSARRLPRSAPPARSRTAAAADGSLGSHQIHHDAHLRTTGAAPAGGASSNRRSCWWALPRLASVVPSPSPSPVTPSAAIGADGSRRSRPAVLGAQLPCGHRHHALPPLRPATMRRPAQAAVALGMRRQGCPASGPHRAGRRSPDGPARPRSGFPTGALPPSPCAFAKNQLDLFPAGTSSPYAEAAEWMICASGRCCRGYSALCPRRPPDWFIAYRASAGSGAPPCSATAPSPSHTQPHNASSIGTCSHVRHHLATVRDRLTVKQVPRETV